MDEAGREGRPPQKDPGAFKSRTVRRHPVETSPGERRRRLGVLLNQYEPPVT